TAKAEIQGIRSVARAKLTQLRLEGLPIVGVDLPEEFVAQITCRVRLVISKNTCRIVAAPRLAGDGVPFEGHHMAGRQSVRQGGLVRFERSFRFLALRDVYVRTDEARRGAIA